MSLKEATWEKHKQAEETAFMKAVFHKEMSKKVWCTFLYNKMHWYNAIELRAKHEGLLEDLPGIERAYLLYKDSRFLEKKYGFVSYLAKPSIEYHKYIMELENPDDVLAHLYVWHMGDLYGGQMIKKVIPDVPHDSLQFPDVDLLRTNLRAKLKDSMATEANVAFDWAIKILNNFEYILNV